METIPAIIPDGPSNTIFAAPSSTSKTDTREKFDG